MQAHVPILDVYVSQSMLWIIQHPSALSRASTHTHTHTHTNVNALHPLGGAGHSFLIHADSLYTTCVLFFCANVNVCSNRHRVDHHTLQYRASVQPQATLPNPTTLRRPPCGTSWTSIPRQASSSQSPLPCCQQRL